MEKEAPLQRSREVHFQARRTIAPKAPNRKESGTVKKQKEDKTGVGPAWWGESRMAGYKVEGSL